MNHMQAVAFMKQVYLYTMELFLKHRYLLFYIIFYLSGQSPRSSPLG
jgi:hypothetical protein